MKIRSLFSPLKSDNGNAVSNRKKQQLEFSPTLQLLFGHLDSATSAVRDSIRTLIFDRTGSKGTAKTKKTIWSRMELDFEDESTEFRQPDNFVWISNDSADDGGFNDLQLGWFRNTTNEVDKATYRCFFDINFGDGPAAGNELCRVLKHRFHVALGDHASSEKSSLRNAETVNLLQTKIDVLERSIGELNQSSTGLEQELSGLRNDHPVEPEEFAISQKQTLESRIEKLQGNLENLQNGVCDVERQIQQLSQQQFARPTVSPNAGDFANLEPADGTSDDGLLQRQIQRWKAVQSDIDARINDLKSDLNSSRLDEFDSAFDEVRMLLRTAENKTSDLGSLVNRLSNENPDALNNDVSGLQSVHYQVCEAISEIQVQWRHKLVASELKELNRCSQELDGYVSRLNEKRLAASKRNRKMGISSGQFCKCSRHPFIPSVDNLGTRNRLNERLDDLLNEIELTQRMLNQAMEEYHSINLTPDDEMRNRTRDCEARLKKVQAELHRLETEKVGLKNRLELEQSKPRQRTSQSMLYASEFLKELTGKQICRIFLGDKGEDVFLVDSDGKVSGYNQSNLVTRNRVRLAISLAACRLLSENNYKVPMVLEDLFIGLDEDEIHSMTDLLEKFANFGHQIILLTNNQLVRDCFKSRALPCLDLPDRFAGDPIPYSPTERRTSRPNSYTATIDWKEINRSFDLAAMDQYGEQLHWYEDEKGKLKVSRSDSHHRETSVAAKNMQSESLRRERNQREVAESSTANRSEKRRSMNRSSSDAQTIAFSSAVENAQQGDSLSTRMRDSGSYRRRDQTDQRSGHDQVRNRTEHVQDYGYQYDQSEKRSDTHRGSSGEWRFSSRRNDGSSRSSHDRSRRGYSERSSSSNRSGQRSRVRSERSGSSSGRSVCHSDSSHRFYLELDSNVEAAPTIGPRTAERLEKIGIVSVSDLLESDAQWIVNELQHKRTKTEHVIQWQHQALLVCQVPNLRGHDAQLLVACGITDSDQLSQQDPNALFDIVGPFSQSKDGQKLLRGANEPDLEEVENWVSWAQDSRYFDRAA